MYKRKKIFIILLTISQTPTETYVGLATADWKPQKFKEFIYLFIKKKYNVL